MKKLFALLVTAFLTINITFAQTHIKLIVGIVVEQMRFDFLTRYWDKYSDNGFKRLLNSGTVFYNAGFDYLNINSATSYTNIATGTHPYIHGIIGKQWYDRSHDKIINCVYDPETVTIGTKRMETAGSPNKVMAYTFSDQLSLSTLGQSQIVVIAPDKQAAILSGGKFADYVLWFDDKSGKWITSSYYTKSTMQLPQWVKDFNKLHLPAVYLRNTWNTTLPLDKYTESMPDATITEKGLAGQTTFPYNLALLKSKTQNKYDLLQHTPFFNTFTKDLAINAIVNLKLGKDDIPDYLFISFQANSNISKVFGIRSVEIEDSYLKLDKDISHLLQTLDDLVGKGNYIIFLTSDRGACDNPNMLKNMGQQVNYFQTRANQVLLDAYLRAVYQQSGLVEKILENQIYLNQQWIDRNHIDPLDIQRLAADLFMQIKSVQIAVPTQVLLTGSFSSGMLYYAYHSYYPGRSGDILFTLSSNSFLETQDAFLPSFSECYCHDNNNNHLPLIFYGGQIPHRSVYRHVDITSIAPTLSALLKMQLPQNATAPVLSEVMVMR